MPDTVGNETLDQNGSLSAQAALGFHPLQIVIPVLIVLVMIGLCSSWYAQTISILRYCENPQTTIQYLQRVINEERPAGENARKPYLIAAKLLFLLPRQSEESVSGYLERVRQYLQEQC